MINLLILSGFDVKKSLRDLADSCMNYMEMFKDKLIKADGEDTYNNYIMVINDICFNSTTGFLSQLYHAFCIHAHFSYSTNVEYFIASSGSAKSFFLQLIQ